MTQANAQPWWLMPLMMVTPPVLWWLAVIFVEYMAARAAADGVTDLEDIFWARILARLDRERFDKFCARRGPAPPPEQP